MQCSIQYDNLVKGNAMRILNDTKTAPQQPKNVYKLEQSVSFNIKRFHLKHISVKAHGNKPLFHTSVMRMGKPKVKWYTTFARPKH